MPSFYVQGTGDVLEPGTISSLTMGRGHGSGVKSVAVVGLVCSAVMSHMMTFQLMMDCAYDGGPKIL